MTPDMEAEIELLERAMDGVTLVLCGICNGSGKVGLPSAEATCPRCLGKKVTTTNIKEATE